MREFLSAVRDILVKAPPAWRVKHTGRPPFNSMSRIMALLVKERYGFTYRQTEIYLKENQQTCQECGVAEIPDHNTIWRTITKLDEPYLKRLNQETNRLFKKERRE